MRFPSTSLARRQTKKTAHFLVLGFGFAKTFFLGLPLAFAFFIGFLPDFPPLGLPPFDSNFSIAAKPSSTSSLTDQM